MAETLSSQVLMNRKITGGTMTLFAGSDDAPLMSAPILLAPLLALLKSGTAIKTVGVISRFSLALVPPLQMQASRLLRYWHGPDHHILYPPPSTDGSSSGGGRSGNHKHFRRTTIVLISLPFSLLAIAFLASLERTPIWGRWRIIMMSTDEEALMVSEVLSAGSPTGPAKNEKGHLDANLDASVPRDWLSILRALLGEPAGSQAAPGTLLGNPVLDPKNDWRVEWVANVLRRLEDSVSNCNLSSDAPLVVETSSEGRLPTKFTVPPVKYPLTVRPALLKHYGHGENSDVSGPLVTRHGCLVIDSPLCNAFSLGFGPVLKTDDRPVEEAPGVVVVYTGFLDEILGPLTPPPQEVVHRLGPFVLYRQIIPRSPQTCPTQQQTEQLAVTLAHELSHLLLSHSIESWASTDTYDLLGTLASDLVRTLLYPLTSFLGPVFNDWFGGKIRVNSAFGMSLKSNCESRKAETEADLLSLRILLAAGFDPRVALYAWGPEGPFQRAEAKEAAMIANTGEEGGDESESWFEKNGFLRTHPVTEHRVLKMKQELEVWERAGRKVGQLSGGPGSETDFNEKTRT